MEILKMVALVVWIGVGVTAIGSTIWGLLVYNKYMKKMVSDWMED